MFLLSRLQQNYHVKRTGVLSPLRQSPNSVTQGIKTLSNLVLSAPFLRGCHSVNWCALATKSDLIAMHLLRRPYWWKLILTSPFINILTVAPDPYIMALAEKKPSMAYTIQDDEKVVTEKSRWIKSLWNWYSPTNLCFMSCCCPCYGSDADNTENSSVRIIVSLVLNCTD